MMTIYSMARLMMVVLLPTVAVQVQAEEPLVYDRVNLSASSTAEIGNDTLIAVLYYQRQGSDLGALANEVNRKIAAVVARSKSESGISVQTLGYQSVPVYEKQNQVAWRVRQAVRLESRNFERLTRLIGELQAQAALESLAYSISEERRTEIEEQLIARAIAAFQARSTSITHHLGRSDYRLVTLYVNTGGAGIRPQLARHDIMAMSEVVAPPAIEPGTQTVRVEVSGTIELQID